MKTMKTISIATCLFALLSVTAFAQNNGLRADVPFTFHAGDSILTAGVYSVNVDTLARRIDIRSTTGLTGTYLTAMLAYAPKAPEQAMLTFHRYGDTYFLKRVSAAGRADAFELPSTSAEREMARNSKPVEVAFRLSR